MGARRAPLLLAAALLAAGAAGPAAADLQPPAPGTVHARPPHVPEPGITIHGSPVSDERPEPVVSVPGVAIWDDPQPVVSVPGVRIGDGPRPRGAASTRSGGPAPTTGVSVPHVSIGPDSVCVYGPGGGVEVGDCHVRPSPPPPPSPKPPPPPSPSPPPRSSRPVPPSTPRPVPRHTPRPVRMVPVPSPKVTPTPTPTPRVAARRRIAQIRAVPRRKNPLGTVLIMVVLVTAIASTTAVAFRVR
ncbi:hypothetical protein ACIA8R_28625 [Nonomuraea sp. NPDC051191]|uniref:hypothetical protein n=1 Tax=Nonomuraea sp. NPDC051191 TaxID=3364372 RepID=UPI0037A47F7F